MRKSEIQICSYLQILSCLPETFLISAQDTIEGGPLFPSSEMQRPKNVVMIGGKREKAGINGVSAGCTVPGCICVSARRACA